MLMIPLSNLVALTLSRIPTAISATCLICTCIAKYFVDLSAFASLAFVTKSVVVGCLTTSPMFFSGLIFIDSFAKTERKDSALGANLMGALVGGALQSVTYISGIKALLLIVATLYTLALARRPSNKRSNLDNRPHNDHDPTKEKALLKAISEIQSSIHEIPSPSQSPSFVSSHLIRTQKLLREPR